MIAKSYPDVGLPRWSPDDDARALRQHVADGGLLAIPSESSYGLGADPRSERGVAAIYRLKGREAGKPLPVVAANIEQILALGVSPQALGLGRAQRLWPAPLSLIFPVERPLAATAGVATLAVRIPAHPLLRRLLLTLGCALTATSANLAGEPPILDPRDLDPLLAGSPSVVIDGGILPGGPPSTLIDPAASSGGVLRPGAFSVERWPTFGRWPRLGSNDG